MKPVQWQLLWINVVLGMAVPVSYGLGFAMNPGQGEALWGGVSAGFRGVYAVSMLGAAAGYFGFAPYLLFRVDPARFVFAGGWGYGTLRWIFPLILIPSAAWMPLTFAWLETPGATLWWSIRIVLVLVGLGSVLLVVALATADRGGRGRGHVVALVGSVLFAWQTAVLDAVVWPVMFR